MPSAPDPPSREQRVNEVLAGYLEASAAGQAPDRAELLARHPDLADELRSCFADHDRMRAAAAPLQPAAPAAEPATVGLSGDGTLPPGRPFATSAIMRSSARLPAAAWGWCTRRGRSASTASSRSK